MSTAIWCIVMPLVFLGISTMVFSGSINDDALALHTANIGCPFPLNDAIDYLNGTIEYNPASGDGTFYICSVGSQSTVIKEYDATAFDFIPIGFLGYIQDWLTVLSTKGSAVLNIVGILSNATIPVSIVAEAPVLVVPYAILFLVLGIGIYLLAHPTKR